jgi:hypothetical protein
VDAYGPIELQLNISERSSDSSKFIGIMLP